MFAAGILSLTALAVLPAIAAEVSSRIVAHAGVASADKPELLPLPERILTALANRDAAVLWDYLTAPDTPHGERVAAALHWSKFLSLGELAKVRSALAELSKEADIHGFGLEQNPHDCSIAHLPSLAEMPDAERRRVIFGHVWMVPKRRDKYPDDMSQAPWPMQATVALDRLHGWSINRLVALDNGTPWLDDAMTMPCNTDAQATEFVRRMGRAFVFMGPAHLRRWRDIALNPAFPGAGVEVADALAGGLLSCSGEKRLLGRALYIELLQQRPLTRMTHDLGYYLYSLRTCGARNDPRRLPLPSPEVMAVAEIAIDRHVPEADRVAYAFAVCEVVDSPPFSSNRQLDRESKEPILLRKFEEWYEANKAEFARQAAAEAPLLRDARKKLLDEEMAQGADTAASTPEAVFASLVMVNDGLQELTGVVAKGQKSLCAEVLKLDGATGSMDLQAGDFLKNIEDGTRIWVKGQIKTELFDSSKLEPGGLCAMPTHWHIFMVVHECKIIDTPFQKPQAEVTIKPAALAQPARELKEPGPAGRDQSIAWSMAATFMAAQCFANTYAKAGGSVSPVAGHPGSYDVSFNALDPAKSNDVAIVRVTITITDKPVSIWLGERPHRGTVGFLTEGGNGNAAAPAEAKTPLSEQQARQVAAAFANEFLKLKTFVDARSTTHPYELLAPGMWRVAERQGAKWILKIDPPDGIFVTVSMALDGTDIRMEQHGYASK